MLGNMKVTKVSSSRNANHVDGQIFPTSCECLLTQFINFSYYFYICPFKLTRNEYGRYILVESGFRKVSISTLHINTYSLRIIPGNMVIKLKYCLSLLQIICTARIINLVIYGVFYWDPDDWDQTGGGILLLFGMNFASYFVSISLLLTTLGRSAPEKILELINLITTNHVKSKLIVGKLRNTCPKFCNEFLFHYILNVFLYQIHLITYIVDDRRIGEAFTSVRAQLTQGNADVTCIKWILETGCKMLKFGFLMLTQFEVLNLEGIGVFFAFLLCKTLHAVVVPLVDDFGTHYKLHRNQEKVMKINYIN